MPKKRSKSPRNPNLPSQEGQVEVTNPRTSRKNARHKELSEIQRTKKSIQAIPAHSTRFLLFRPNRRQKSLQKQQQQQEQEKNQQQHQQHVIFNAQKFTELPLSTRTLDGLAASGFSEMTPIQKLSLPQSLAERDILAAAPTGSGKTLSFVVPVLEKLWRERWTTMDGLGALILSPTRELSMQIFDVIRKVATRHPISAGLVIGGKDFEGERDKVGRMNILVGTPGRVLHHMDTVAEMDCNTLKMLVLDEADRILDMGFKGTIDAILQNLPDDRQTLLYSATQTKDIKALARLSLKSPEYLSVTSSPPLLDQESTNSKDKTTSDKSDSDDADDDENKNGDGKEGNEKSNKNPGDDNDSLAKTSDIKIVGVPTGLTHSYMVVKLEDKLSVLWSFIKTHLKSKMIIFLSSGKQVRFIFEAFCKLRPGMSLLHMHGNMKQDRRTEMYNAFCRTSSAALFATDVASRGLDFPDVEWVVQVDCPDDVATYVHRVGRTARLKKQGRAILLLNEGKEENFLKRLHERGIKDIVKKEINTKKMSRAEIRLTGLLTGSVELRTLAQNAYRFYLKSIIQKSDKEVFNFSELDINGLAKSFGLSVTPKVKFKVGKSMDVGRSENAKLKSKTIFGYDKRFTKNAKDDEEDEKDEEKEENELEVGKAGKKRSRTMPEERASKDESDNDDDILQVKRSYAVGEKIVVGDEDDDDDKKTLEAELSRKEVERERRRRKKRKLDLLKGMGSVNRLVFDDDGNAIRAGMLGEADAELGEEHDGIESYAKSVAGRLKESASDDKLREKERVKAMHAKKRAKQQELKRVLQRGGDDQDDVGMVAGDDDGSEESRGESDDESSSDVENDGNDVSAEEQLALKILGGRST